MQSRRVMTAAFIMTLSTRPRERHSLLRSTAHLELCESPRGFRRRASQATQRSKVDTLARRGRLCTTMRYE